MCGVARAAALLGDVWTLLLVRDLSGKDADKGEQAGKEAGKSDSSGKGAGKAAKSAG